MKGLDIRASATVSPGQKSGRVRVRKRRTRLSASESTYREWKGLYRADRSLKGKGVENRCVSAPAEEWAAIDAEAQRRLMSRSEFLRRAARAYIAGQDRSDDGSGAMPARSTSK